MPTPDFLETFRRRYYPAPLPPPLAPWERQSLEALAQGLRARADDLSTDSASWLEKWLEAPAGPDVHEPGCALTGTPLQISSCCCGRTLRVLSDTDAQTLYLGLLWRHAAASYRNDEAAEEHWADLADLVALPVKAVGDYQPGARWLASCVREWDKAAQARGKAPPGPDLSAAPAATVPSPPAEPQATLPSPQAAPSADDRVLWGVVANAGRLSARRQPRWAHVSDNTGQGSTACAQLCRRFGFDPDEEVGGAGKSASHRAD